MNKRGVAQVVSTLVLVIATVSLFALLSYYLLRYSTNQQYFTSEYFKFRSEQLFEGLAIIYNRSEQAPPTLHLYVYNYGEKDTEIHAILLGRYELSQDFNIVDPITNETLQSIPPKKLVDVQINTTTTPSYVTIITTYGNAFSKSLTGGG